MNTRAVILNVPFDGHTPKTAINTLLSFLKSSRNHLVVTPNPEAVMLAQRNGNFMRIIQNADLVLADGIGIILAAKFRKLPIPTRVTGVDTTLSLLKAASASGYSCYLLGAAPGVAEKARYNLQQQGIIVLGAHNGFFNKDSEKEIIDEINSLKPDILLVGMGMPRQEEWAAGNLHKLPCKITICIGGGIDIFAENIRRAPKILRFFGLEWLYRLITDPSRGRRMLDLPRFVWAVIRDY